MTEANPVWLGITNVAVLAVDASNYVASLETGHVFVPKTPETFTYDADGNLLSDGRWNYTWDAKNRLIRVQSRSDTPQASWRRVEWTYDTLGRRIRQTTSDGSSGSWVVTEDLKFVSDPVLFGRHIAELRASDNALVRSYVWGLDLSGLQEGAGGVGGLLWLTQHAGPNTGTHFAAYDGNGNIVALSATSDGSESARYEYGPFGEPIRVTGPTAKENPFRFSTKRTDNTTDLVLYEYRVYQPSTGKWLSRDPIGAIGGINLYGMLGNNPINRSDRLGLKGFPYPYPPPQPPPPPRQPPDTNPVPAGQCRIQVCCVPVSITVWEHCYVRFDDENGAPSCRAGPSRRTHGSGSSGSQGGVPSHCNKCCGFWGTLIGGCGAPGSPEMAGDFEARGQNCVTIGQSAAMCGVIDCVRRKIQEINQQCVRYRVKGPNTNSAIYTALQQCMGISPPKPAGSKIPGWRPINNDDTRCN